MKDERGRDRIDPVAADAAWDANTNPGKQASMGGADKARGPSYAESRAIREAYQARLAKLEYEEKISKLVEVDKVKLEAFELGRMLRDLILNIPNRISTEAASETDPVKVHSLLTVELNKALEEIVNATKRRDSLP